MHPSLQLHVAQECAHTLFLHVKTLHCGLDRNGHLVPPAKSRGHHFRGGQGFRVYGGILHSSLALTDRENLLDEFFDGIGINTVAVGMTTEFKKVTPLQRKLINTMSCDQ